MLDTETLFLNAGYSFGGYGHFGNIIVPIWNPPSKRSSRMSPPGSNGPSSGGNAPSPASASTMAAPEIGYGAGIPKVWGKIRVKGNVFWARNPVPHQADFTFSGTGDGGPVNTYKWDFAVGLCEGPVLSIPKIYADGKELSNLTGIRKYLGTEDQAADARMQSVMGGDVPAYRGLCYLAVTWYGERLPAITADVIQSAGALVNEICRDVAAECGLIEDEDFEFGCADDSIRGYVRDGKQSGRAVLDPLQRYFFFDFAEIDGKLKAIPRNGPSVATVDADHMGARVVGTRDNQASPTAEIVRRQDIDLPYRVDVSYYDIDKTYDSAVQSATKHATEDVQGVDGLTAPVALTASEAQTVAEVDLRDQWDTRIAVSLRLLPRYVKYGPGSVIEAPINGQTVRLRVVRTDVGLFGPVALTCVTDSEATREQSGSGSGSETEDAPADEPIPTSFDAWSGTEIQDSHALSAGFYVVGTGATGWGGATVYYRPTGSSDWVRAGTVSSKGVFGTATDLADWASAAEDTTNTADLTCVSPGSLTTVTTAQRTAGLSRIRLGSEILSYLTATLQSGTTYEIASLLRGQRDTPTSHGSGEKFCLLNGAVTRISVADSLVGESLDVICVSPGETVGSQTPVTVTIAEPTSPYPTQESLQSSLLFPHVVASGDIETPEVLFENGDVIEEWTPAD
jgi:hypothetical protein